MTWAAVLAGSTVLCAGPALGALLAIAIYARLLLPSARRG